MFMVILMLVGQDQPETSGSRRSLVPGILSGAFGLLFFVLALEQLVPASNKIVEASTVGAAIDDLGFLWRFQSWDLLFVILPLTAAVLVLVNLFSKEGEVD